MKKVVVVGAGGRMGRTLIRCLRAGVVPDLELAGAVDLWDHPERGRDVGLLAGCGETGIVLTCDLKPLLSAADVVVDFSAHKGTAGNAPRAAEAGKALVIGTTGLEPEERRAVEEAARRIPIVWSPNMSVGMNLLFSLVERTAAALRDKGYDCEIIERHHRHKKDAPSGSALRLGEAAARGFGWDASAVAIHGRQGNVGERPVQQIGYHAVRGGDIVGDHTVMFATDGELIELSHRATSRDAFAIGALRAASWVVGQKPGLYSMRDVLGL
jgi:4-hydroxy-tetrahydrodipicolinate reductase